MAQRYLTNQMAHALLKCPDVPDSWYDLIVYAAYKDSYDLTVKQYNKIISLFNLYICVPAGRLSKKGTYHV